MKSTSVAALLVSSLALTFAQHSPDSVIRGTKQFSKRVVASGLAGPWELTWGPDAKLWVTERTGKRVVPFSSSGWSAIPNSPSRWRDLPAACTMATEGEVAAPTRLWAI